MFDRQRKFCEREPFDRCHAAERRERERERERETLNRTLESYDLEHEPHLLSLFPPCYTSILLSSKCSVRNAMALPNAGEEARGGESSTKHHAKQKNKKKNRAHHPTTPDRTLPLDGLCKGCKTNEKSERER
jgi:hypothetical protein